MASVCVNNSPALPAPFDLNPSPNPNSSMNLSSDPSLPSSSDPKKQDPGPDRDGSAKDLFDFEFRLHDPVAMLTADELFSDGKLVPLQMSSSSRQQSEISSQDPMRSTIRSEIFLSDPSISSPKAPKCSSRWRDLLGLKKLQSSKLEASSKTPNPRSIRNLLNRNQRSTSSSSEASLSLPLLRDSDSDSLSLSSSRLSLSSTSSSSDSCDLPRLSLDSDKQNQMASRSGLNRNGWPARARSRPVRRSVVDAESPRMNSSGKVVFYSGSLERSSSSPGSFIGGPRVRPRGMERSFSANVVRVNPVLNVPVCSLRGSGKPGSVFGFFSTGSKKDKDKEKEKEKEAKGSGGKLRSEWISRD